MSSSVQCIESVGSPFFPATRGGAASRAQMGLSRAAPQNLVGRAALAALGALKGGCAELSIGLCSRGTAIGGGGTAPSRPARFRPGWGTSEGFSKLGDSVVPSGRAALLLAQGEGAQSMAVTEAIGREGKGKGGAREGSWAGGRENRRAGSIERGKVISAIRDIGMQDSSI